MNYDDSGYITYAFFPRYDVAPEGRVEWGFCCFQILQHSYACEVFEDGYENRRIQMIDDLWVIQRHTAELAERLKNFTLPLI